MTETLRELLARCCAGDEEAVATLVARFRPWALDLASALAGDRTLAEDVVQESFVAALDGLDRLREPEAFPGWLGQIIRRLANRMARKRRELPLPDESASPSKEEGPFESAHREQLRQTVRDALAALPPTARRTAELFYLEEWTCSEIADGLHVPLGTVKRRLHDARSRLRGMLLGYVGEQAPEEEPDTGATGPRAPF